MFFSRAKHDQSDHTICDLQGQLAHAQSELSRTLDRNKSLEHQQFHLDNQTKELKQEINTLRCNISQLERQKEQLEVTKCSNTLPSPKLQIF